MIADKQKTVLYLDDDKEDLILLDRLLQDSNVRVEAVSKPLEAIFNLTQNEYDYFLVDFNLPVMTADGLIKSIKENNLEHMRIVVVTGIGKDEVKKKFEDQGIADSVYAFLDKKELEDLETVMNKNRKVLLIDDDKHTQECFIEGMSENFGINYVDIAFDVSKGIERVEMCAYDYVFIDFTCPKMNIENFKKIISLKKKWTKVYIFTAYSKDYVIRKMPEVLEYVDGILEKNDMVTEFEGVF